MDSFNQRKESILSKEDKAAKGSWDSRVVGLCNKLNASEDYYTTSSCSGKAVIMEEKVGKDGSYYLWSSHDEIGFDELKEAVGQLTVDGKLLTGIVKFKSEAPIIFVVCRDIESAKELFGKCVKCGFKETGIKITKKLIGVEIRSGEKVEFPLMNDGELLLLDEFLRVLVEEVNRKRMVGWDKILKLTSSL
ncbi:MAG: tRNA wybutosine-synthesizing 3 family protein [Nanoarchaeota archaeon]|nr:tRNA wybutosine-synthesizing 3 family protein [Nanoarchaeota archaeon]